MEHGLTVKALPFVEIKVLAGNQQNTSLHISFILQHSNSTFLRKHNKVAGPTIVRPAVKGPEDALHLKAGTFQKVRHFKGSVRPVSLFKSKFLPVDDGVSVFVQPRPVLIKVVFMEHGLALMRSHLLSKSRGSHFFAGNVQQQQTFFF